VASAGPVTVLAESRGLAVVVQRVVAQGKGRLSTAGSSVVSSVLPGGLNADLAVATNGREAVVAGALPEGPTGVSRVSEADTAVATSVSLPGSCDVAADPRPTSRTFWAACSDGALHRSTDGGATFARASAFPAQGRPQLDVAPDGTPYVLAGSKLVALRAGRVVVQDLALPRGEHSGTAFAVSNRGRVAASTYTRSAPGEGWHVQVAMFSPGSRPVWYDFADHDPVTPQGAAAPPSVATSVDTDPLGRLQLVWASTFLHSPSTADQLDRPLLRNVFAARSVTS
jgi:hypothetical protein